MPRKKTHEEFLEEVKALVGDEYEVIGKYVNDATKIEMKHTECDYEYDVRPNSFLGGTRCPECSGRMRKTTEQYKKEVFDLVGNEYIVLGEYINSQKKIKMKHNECGYEYDVQAGSFLMGSRCKQCKYKKLKKSKTMTNEQFDEKLFDISKGSIIRINDYINSQTKIKFFHDIDECGHIWESVPSSILFGTCCPKCSGLMKKTTEMFKNEVYKLVKDEYEVLGIYINNKTKIKMKHKKCNKEYDVRPNGFLMGKRCPKCSFSKGEKKVSVFLDKFNFTYKSQYSCNDCKNKKPLPFDFAILNHNKTLSCLIEYDGRQHFEPVDIFGGEDGFKQTQKHDQIKTQYCKDNNIKLIRIPYWDFDNIEDILNEELKDLINSEDYTQQAS